MRYFHDKAEFRKASWRLNLASLLEFILLGGLFLLANRWGAQKAWATSIWQILPLFGPFFLLHYISQQRIVFSVMGRNTIAAYCPIRKMRAFIKRSDCRSYRPAKNAIVTHDGKEYSLGPLRLPPLYLHGVNHPNPLAQWWPELTEFCHSDYRPPEPPWHWSTGLLALGFIGTAGFVITLALLAGHILIGVGCLLCAGALVAYRWFMHWSARRNYEVLLAPEATRL